MKIHRDALSQLVKESCGDIEARLGVGKSYEYRIGSRFTLRGLMPVIKPRGHPDLAFFYGDGLIVG
jgi:hypothetical protein